jgi:CheY-like chemotaxis protein
LRHGKTEHSYREDDDGIYELVSALLVERGFDVDWRRTAAETRAYLDESTPYLMILDYGLPDMNAQELVESLRAHFHKVPPFILSTGQGDERVAVNMMKLGARDYLVKDALFLERIPEVVRRVCAELENERRLAAAESALLESEILLRGIFEQTPMGIQVVTPDGMTVNVNPAFESIWNRSRDSVVGTLNILTDADSFSSGLPEVVRSRLGESCFTNEFRWKAGDAPDSDEKRIFRVIAFPIKNRTRSGASLSCRRILPGESRPRKRPIGSPSMTRSRSA